MEKAISIIIVNWNGGTFLQSCIQSVSSLTLSIEKIEIIIVDNGSMDNSLDSIERHENITIIESQSNLGFAKACNLGSQYATGKYLLFLNPDARVFSDTLKAVFDFMELPQNRRVAVCGIPLINEKGEIERNSTYFPTAMSMLSRASGLDRIFPRLGYFMNDWPHQESRLVDHVIGAFYFIRRSVFEELNGFDERFFLYLEDLDLSLRVKDAGWDVYFFAQARAFHSGGGTSRQVRAKRLFYSFRSRVLYSYKYFNVFSAALILLTTLLIEPLSRSVFSLLKRNPAGFRETWGAWWLFLSWLPKWFFKGQTRE